MTTYSVNLSNTACEYFYSARDFLPFNVGVSIVHEWARIMRVHAVIEDKRLHHDLIYHSRVTVAAAVFTQ